MPLSELVFELGNDSVCGVDLRGVDEIVVLEKRADIRIRQGIKGQGLLNDRGQTVRRDDVPGKRRAQVLKIAGGDRLAGIVSGIGGCSGQIVDGQQVAGLVHGLRKVTATLKESGNGVQRGACDALADALIGQREERALGIREQVRDEYRAGDIEAELIAPQWGYALAVLSHLVRYGIENVVTEVLIETAVPEQLRALMPLRGPRAFWAHAQLAGQNLEFFRRAGERLRLLGGRFAVFRGDG